MAIKEQIQNILDVRRQKGNILRQKKEVFQNMKTSLRACDSLYSQAKEIEDEKLRAQYMELFAAVQTKEIQKEIDRLLQKLEAGIRRFDRDYISIATVGRARQGKSQFLQSVGNLDNSIIPAYSASDCTGATSVIHNDPAMEPGTVRVTVTFRQQEELLKIVQAYIQGIYPDYLEENTLEFEDIAYINLAELERHVEKGNADQSTPLGHLSKIVSHFDEIRELYGKAPLTMTSPELIKTYVAQNNGKAVGDPEVEYYYKYLAVARADIYCRFYEDCGKIVLVDTVGLEDTQYGIEEAMLNTVDKECDAAIVVTKPNAGVHTSDIAIYNLLRKHFQKRDMQKWLFYIANLHKGVNDNVVGTFAKDISGGNYDLCDCRVVDCYDQEAVRDEFLLPMLTNLIRNMEDIDGAYLKELNDQSKAVLQKYRQYISDMPEAKTFNPESQAGIKAFLKGKECYHRMTADLRNQVEYWSDEKDKPNGTLWNRVQRILNSLDHLAPSPEMLQKAIDENGSLLPSDLWHAALHYTRNEITDQFNAIDKVLELETQKFKNSLVRHLYYALKNISDNEDEGKEQYDGTEKMQDEEVFADEGKNWEEAEDCNMVEWLKTVMDHVINDKPQYDQIYKAFQFLYQFEFNTRAQLIQEIRRQLYIINPICREYAAPGVTFRKANAGQGVYFYLTSRLSVIEDDLRYSLVSLYRTPNQAFYAAAEEFYDRLTFASNLKDGQFVSMDTVWGQFFMEYSNRLWADNAERYDRVNALVQQYNQIQETLNSLAEQAGF